MTSEACQCKIMTKIKTVSEKQDNIVNSSFIIIIYDVYI